MKGPQPLIFELSSPGRPRPAFRPRRCTPNLSSLLPAHVLRNDLPGLPEVSEMDVVRHFVNLSQLNHSVDNGFYHAGSCHDTAK